MADDPGEEVQEIIEDGETELDPLAGQELFDVPDDLADMPDPGAPAPGAQADPAKGGPPAAKPGAPKPRDEQTGKFVPAKDAAPATDEGQPPKPDPADPSAPPAPGEAADEEAEPEPELEFSFRADGQQIQIKGSRITADGIFIPKQHQAEFQRLLSNGVTYRGSFKQRLLESKREVEETKAQVQEDTERAQAFLKFWADMADREEKGETDAEGRSPLEAWLFNFRQNRVKLEAEAELAVARAYREKKPGAVKLEGFDDDPPPAADEPEEDLEELSQTLADPMAARLQGVMKAENIRGLTGQEVTRIRDWMVAPERLGQFFMRAQEDIPAKEWGGSHDIKKGQIVAMHGPIREAFKHQANLILDARKSATELAAAAKQNARGGEGKNPIPPVVPVNGNAVPKGSKVPPHFPNTPEGKKQMEAWFNAEDPLS